MGEGWDLPQLGIRGLQNFLKLRTRHRFSDRLTADLGVDINALNQAIIPRAALSYQVCPVSVWLGGELPWPVTLSQMEMYPGVESSKPVRARRH